MKFNKEEIDFWPTEDSFTIGRQLAKLRHHCINSIDTNNQGGQASGGDSGG